MSKNVHVTLPVFYNYNYFSYFQSLPHIVEQTLKSLQGLNLNDNSTFSPPLMQMADEPTTCKGEIIV